MMGDIKPSLHGFGLFVKVSLDRGYAFLFKVHIFEPQFMGRNANKYKYTVLSAHRKNQTEPPTLLPNLERKYGVAEEISSAPHASSWQLIKSKKHKQIIHLPNIQVTQTLSLLMEDLQLGHLHRQHPCFRALVAQPWLKIWMLSDTFEGLKEKNELQVPLQDFKTSRDTSCISWTSRNCLMFRCNCLAASALGSTVLSFGLPPLPLPLGPLGGPPPPDSCAFSDCICAICPSNIAPIASFAGAPFTLPLPVIVVPARWTSEP